MGLDRERLGHRQDFEKKRQLVAATENRLGVVTEDVGQGTPDIVQEDARRRAWMSAEPELGLGLGGRGRAAEELR